MEMKGGEEKDEKKEQENEFYSDISITSHLQSPLLVHVI